MLFEANDQRSLVASEFEAPLPASTLQQRERELGAEGNRVRKRGGPVTRQPRPTK